MKRYDVVIVGAGFAGLACAREAALLGLRVCVLERQAEPGRSVHTTGIVVREAAERMQIPATLTRRVEGVRLYAPSLRYVDLDAPDYYFLATDTGGLLRWMTEQAVDAGAELQCGAPFRHAWQRPDEVIVNEREYAASFLIGADGARSRVASRFGLGRNTEFLLGVEAHFRGLRLPAERLHCFVDSDLASGYIGWAVPGVDDVVQIGVACRRPLKPDLELFIRKLRPLFNFDSAQLVEKRAGAIPVGGPVRAFARERVLLIGDAAGLVSPLTAGGIHTAIESGVQAARAIAAHLRSGAVAPKEVLRKTYPRFFWKRALRFLFDVPLSNTWLERLLFNGLARRVAQLVFFHREGLKRAAGWRALFGTRRVVATREPVIHSSGSAEASSDRRPAAQHGSGIQHTTTRTL
jgi:geranylgeranyl reductase family protein